MHHHSTCSLIPSEEQNCCKINENFKENINEMISIVKDNLSIATLDKEYAIHNFNKENIQNYFTMSNLYRKLLNNNICKYCWMIHSQCFCNKLKPFHFNSKWNTKIGNLNIYFDVLYTRKEFGKSTNSCKILLQCNTFNNCNLYLDELKLHENKLNSLINLSKNKNTFVYVLFPSNDAISIHDAITMDILNNNELNNELINNELTNKEYNIHIIVLDSTWNGARMLLRKDYLNNLKRIKVNVPIDYNYIFKVVRTSKCEGRISTVEAMLLLLKELNNDLKKDSISLENLNEKELILNNACQNVYDNINLMIDISDTKRRRGLLLENNEE